MKIIFLGNTGVHHALVAANIFLGRLKESDFRLIEGFCDLAKDSTGFPIFIDKDEEGNEIYTVGAGKELIIAQKTINELVRVFGCSSRDLIVKPVSIKGEKVISLLSKIPDMLGRSYLNFHISSYIISKDFPRLFREIMDFKNQVKNMSS